MRIFQYMFPAPKSTFPGQECSTREHEIMAAKMAAMMLWRKMGCLFFSEALGRYVCGVSPLTRVQTTTDRRLSSICPYESQPAEGPIFPKFTLDSLDRSLVSMSVCHTKRWSFPCLRLCSKTRTFEGSQMSLQNRQEINQCSWDDSAIYCPE